MSAIKHCQKSHFQFKLHYMIHLFYVLQWMWQFITSKEFRAGITIFPTIIIFPLLLLYGMNPEEFGATFLWIVPLSYLIVIDRLILRWRLLYREYKGLLIGIVLWLLFSFTAGYITTTHGQWLGEYILGTFRWISFVLFITFVWVGVQPFIIVLISFQEE